MAQSYHSQGTARNAPFLGAQFVVA